MAAKLTFVLTLAGALIAAGLTLFGSGASPITDPVARAATVSAGAAGFVARISMTMTTPVSSAPLTATGEGTFDLAGHAGSLSMAMSFPDDPQIAQALGSSVLSMREIVDGTTVYMQLPGAVMQAMGAGGQSWVKIDASKVASLRGLASLRANPASQDPTQMLRFLRAASDSVVAEGRQRVDGFWTTRYRAQLDLDRVLAVLPTAEQAGARAALAPLEQSLPVHTIPLDVWIDANRLVRRFSEQLSMQPSSGGALAITFTMDIPHYGPEPRPTPPPAGDVRDLTALAGALG